MNKSILVTGVPGTGKTTIAKRLKKKGYNAYSIEDVDGLFDMHNKETKQKTTDDYVSTLENAKDNDWICDIKKMRKLIGNNSEQTTFYCGVASNLKEIIPLFDEIILLIASKRILRHRLANRKKNDFAKTQDVQEWIFSWMDSFENKVKGFNPIIIENNNNLEDIINKLIRISNRQ